MNYVLLAGIIPCGAAVVSAVTGMVVQLVRVRTQRQILFKSIEDTPADKRPATIRAVSVLIGQMSEDRSSARFNVTAAAKRLRGRDRTSSTPE